MITIRTSSTKPIHIDIHMFSPCVYLDQCVLGDFAGDPVLGSKFHDLLKDKNGTLCLSALHIMENSGLCPGILYSKIKSYLQSFGNQFVILNFDPHDVLVKEKISDSNGMCPAFDIELIKELVLKWNGLSSINLGILFEIIENNPSLCTKLKTFYQIQKNTFHNGFKTARNIYLTDARAKKNVASLKCPPTTRTSILEYLSFHIRQICYKQDLSPNDTFDFFHVIVPTAYADFVVLDKKWATRVRRIKLPKGSAQIFSTIEYDKLFKRLAASSQVTNSGGSR